VTKMSVKKVIFFPVGGILTLPLLLSFIQASIGQDLAKALMNTGGSV